MPRKLQRGIRKKKSGKEGVSSSFGPYEVELAEPAETIYKDLHFRAAEAEAKGDPSNSICTTFRMVQEAIKKIIPADPINRKHALSGSLSNIFRLHKGRLRICWIASSELRKVYILFISETLRKQGDINDPYNVFEKLLKSGKLDGFFSRLGVKKPFSSATSIR